jgi:hypothetical protein
MNFDIKQWIVPEKSDLYPISENSAAAITGRGDGS